MTTEPYTPDEAELIGCYAGAMEEQAGEDYATAKADAERGIAKIRAEAWDEGNRAANIMLPTDPPQKPKNPPESRRMANATRSRKRDRTMTDTVKAWVEERQAIHAAATDGPWYKTPNDRILSESVQWPEGDDYDVAGGFGRDGAVVEAIHDFDGNAIVDAHSNFPRALDALNSVLKVCDKALAVRVEGSSEGEVAMAAMAATVKRAIEGAIND